MYGDFLPGHVPTPFYVSMLAMRVTNHILCTDTIHGASACEHQQNATQQLCIHCIQCMLAAAATAWSARSVGLLGKCAQMQLPHRLVRPWLHNWRPNQIHSLMLLAITITVSMLALAHPFLTGAVVTHQLSQGISDVLSWEEHGSKSANFCIFIIVVTVLFHSLSKFTYERQPHNPEGSWEWVSIFQGSFLFRWKKTEVTEAEAGLQKPTFVKMEMEGHSILFYFHFHFTSSISSLVHCCLRMCREQAHMHAHAGLDYIFDYMQP